MKITIRLLCIPVILAAFAVCLFGCAQKSEVPGGSMQVDLVTDRDGSAYTVRNGCEKVSFRVENGKACQVGLTVKKQSGKLKQTRVEHDTPENGYFTHLVMLSALPYVSMPAASSYTMHAKYPLSGSKKF